jgi:ABC-type transport system involved in multi-copper enzyme maturation permease subunit
VSGIGLLARKELAMGARNPRGHLMRGLFAAALLLCTMPVLLETSRRVSHLADRGRELFLFTVHAEMYLLSLLAPLAVATAFSDEKENGTTGLLLLLPIAPWRVVLGKVLGRLVVLELVLLSGLPLLALAFAMGGVSPGELVVAVLVIQVALLGAVVVTTHAAVLLDSALAATLVAYGFVVFFFGLGPVGSWALSFGHFRLDSAASSWFWVSPFYTLTLSVGSRSALPAWQAIVGPASWLAALAGFVLASAGTLWSMAGGVVDPEAAAERLRRPRELGSLVVGGTAVMLPVLGLLAAISRQIEPYFARFWGLWGGLVMLALALLLLRAVAASGQALVQRRRPVPASTVATVGLASVDDATPGRAEVWDDPVLWRELCTRGHGSLTSTGNWIGRSLLVLLVLVMLGSSSFYTRGETRAIFGSFSLAAACLMLLLLSSSCIVTERRDGTLPLLRISTYPTDRYVLAKLVGVLWAAAVPLGLGFLLVASVGEKALPSLGWLASYLFFGTAAGMWASARARRPVGALGLATLLAVGPLLAVLLLAFFRVPDSKLAWAFPFMVGRSSSPIVESALGYLVLGAGLLGLTGHELRRRPREGA